MDENIEPGSTINIKVVKTPTNAAALKTLARVLNKDRAMMAQNKRQRDTRKKNFRTIRRGGRPYPIYMVKHHLLDGHIGESGTVIATFDVLQDLTRLGRFVEVSKA